MIHRIIHDSVSLLHTAAYWLLRAVRQATPAAEPLRRAGFATLQNRLVKIGARIIETASRVRIASACPDKALVALIFRAFLPASKAKVRAP